MIFAPWTKPKVKKKEMQTQRKNAHRSAITFGARKRPGASAGQTNYKVSLIVFLFGEILELSSTYLPPRAKDSWRSCKTFPLPYFPLREEEDVISILSSAFEYTKSHSAWRSDLAVTENNKSRGSTFGPIDKFGLLLVPLWSDSTMDDWGAGLHHSCGERKGWCSRRQWGH